MHALAWGGSSGECRTSASDTDFATSVGDKHEGLRRA
eukprot:SAG25_NODE_3578_length_1035_cov_1.201923_2_plen_36_part_01